MNTEYQLKSKLAWPVYAKSMKLKQMVQEQWLQLKRIFLKVITWKLLFRLGEGREIYVLYGGTEIYVLNASVLNSSFLEGKLFTFRCPKCMPLLLNTFYLYEMESKGGYLRTKMILYRHYRQYEKKHGIVNSPIFYNHYVYHYQIGPCYCIFYIPLDCP